MYKNFDILAQSIDFGLSVWYNIQVEKYAHIV